jgi:hypothetical protein
VPELGPGQTLPQAPQLLGLVFKLTHEPPHPVCPEAQHTPWLQEFCRVHLFPQLPQLLLSVCSLTQAPPHRFGVGVRQAMLQVPPEHVG